MICKNCIHKLIPVWKNSKIHSDSGEQEFLHGELKRECFCGCKNPEPCESKAVSQR